MKLRDTFLGSTIGLVTVAFVALAAMLYTVYAEEMLQRTLRHIEETRALLVEHINARTGAIIDGLETVYRPLHDTLQHLDRLHANTSHSHLPEVHADRLIVLRKERKLA